MALKHLDRLSALDASFLHQEGPEAYTHIGALAIIDGPVPPREELLAQIGSRLHLLPRSRQRLARTPLDRGRPVWIDDPAFRLDFHARHAALPAPGGREQLLALASRIFSSPLDRRRPLWELWLVEGLHDDRFALIFKTHHAVIDGMGAVDLATVVFDQSAERDAGEAVWAPAQRPSLMGLLALGATRDALDGLGLLTRFVAAAAQPRQSASRLGAAVEGIGALARATLNPAPATPLNVPIGPYRRFTTVACRLEDFKTIKNAFGGTVNDVVLAVVTGALRRFLESRDVRTEGLELRALVPVSLRGSGDDDGDGAAMGNRVSAMRAALPVYIADPLARLQAVRNEMDAVKRSRQALGTEVLASAQDFAPPTFLARASRLPFSTRLFNLLVTNVPGPQRPLHVLGREIREVYPIAFLPRDHALSIAIISYNGQLSFGLLADYDTLAELEQIGGWVAEEIALLLGLAHDAGAAPRVSSGRRGGP